jgi:glutathione S-transferase
MYTVYGTPRSRAFRVMWMLEELGEAYDLVPATPQSPEIRAVNPEGKVPALGFDGQVFTDSIAIVQFLADRHGRFTAPAGTPERLTQDGYTHFCIDEVEGALWTAGKHRFALPEHLRVPQVKETARAEFDLAMQRLERRLGDRPFVTDLGFTVPDLLFGHCAGWAISAKFDLPGGTVGAYFERLRARPAFNAAMRRGASL